MCQFFFFKYCFTGVHSRFSLHINITIGNSREVTTCLLENCIELKKNSFFSPFLAIKDTLVCRGTFLR